MRRSQEPFDLYSIRVQPSRAKCVATTRASSIWTASFLQIIRHPNVTSTARYVCTQFGFVVVAGLFYAYTLQTQTGGIRKRLSRNFLAFLFFICLPVLAALVWTHYTDEVRSRNVIGILTTSPGAPGWSFRWTFGPFSQRFLPNTWKILFDRTIPDLFRRECDFNSSAIGFFARHRLFLFMSASLVSYPRF